jgi:tetratricopeptide (TPR) repeat protein
MSAAEPDPDLWARARELFLDLAELGPEPRAAALAQVAAQDPQLAAWVTRLLQNDPGQESAPNTKRFGPYQVTRPIARGGMGEVFLARRVDGEFERDVAIKLLRCQFRGDELLRRFQRERQTLAALDHEYVARLLDGGTTPEGEPYLVMEYVEGLPLDRHCAELDLGLRARLELFLRVLSAVQHAHGRGVIHRDLKPSNVLVRADGSPRLLDFGISRPEVEDVTPDGPLTRTGHRLFTPEYASPEQVRGEEVTPATDVFALGVMLYELLTGERPWRVGGGPLELELAILQQDPVPPSRHERGTARRAIAGDLDTIVLKCLAKAPMQRYAGALDLAADLDLHLRGFPIRARRVSPWLRAWRFARRRPWTVFGGAALVTAIATAGLAVVQTQQSRARARELAVASDARLEGAADLRRRGQFDAARQELQAILASSAGLSGAQVLRARACAALAVVDNHQHRWDAALDWLERADGELAIADEVPPELRASVLNARAFALYKDGRREQARTVAEAALEHARAALPPGHEQRTDALLELADQDTLAGDYDQAFALLDEAVAGLRARGDPRDSNLAQVLNSYGVTLSDQGRHAEGLERLLEARTILSFHLGAGDPTIARLSRNIGTLQRRLGRFDESRLELEAALARFREVGQPLDVAESLRELGDLEREAGRYEAALAALGEARDLCVQEFSDRHPVLARFDRWLAEVHELRGDLGPARQHYERCLGGAHSIAAYGPADEGQARAGLGRVLLALGETEAGRAELRQALEALERAHGPDHAQSLAVRALLDG